MKYLAHRIARCIAATIAGRKPATLMNISNDNGGLLDTWDRHRSDIFIGSEIDYYELKRTDRNAIVLFFDQNRLNELLRGESVNKFLFECGYESDSIDHALNMLKQRYATGRCP
ncbi:MAG: DUF3793 family protein, partial [Euryarchaeota archaeon]|nr:DUF3793 family protein [Euryarchaeota archaeon]